MALRGKKPNSENQRLRMLLSGPAGVGKTTAAIQMPKPYIIDCERGAQNPEYTKKIIAAGGEIFEPADMHDIIKEVRELMAGGHDFLTVVIDSITAPYHALGDEGERKVGTEFSKNYKQYADKFVRRLVHLLTVIDMNVVVIAHEKAKWGKDAKGDPSVLGVTFDGYQKLDYMFDLYLQLSKDEKRKRKAFVEKTRYEQFPDGDSFEWSYSELARRMGDDLTRDVHAIELATPEQVARLEFLMAPLTGDQTKAWGIDKALKGVESIADLTAERIAAAIAFIEKKAAVDAEKL